MKKVLRMIGRFFKKRPLEKVLFITIVIALAIDHVQVRKLAFGISVLILVILGFKQILKPTKKKLF